MIQDTNRTDGVDKRSPIQLALSMAETIMAVPAPYNVHWCYENGLVLHAMAMLWRRTGNADLFTYVRAEVDRFVRADGSIETFDSKDWNIDNILEGRVLFPLLAETGEERYQKAMHAVRAQLDTHPRTTEGGFWHKRIYPNQMWLDGLYMGDVFYAEYSAVFGDAPGLFDATRQLLLMAAHGRDPQSGLFYHGWDESRAQSWANPETGCSPCFWGRAMGWYVMALVDVLEVIDAQSGGHASRGELLDILKNLMQALARHRDPSSGRWLQLVDRPDLSGNYPESSASAMIAYAMMKGARLGWLSPEHAEMGRNAFDRLAQDCARVAEHGRFHLAGICRVAGLGGTPYRDGSPAYYLSEEVVADDYKGTGPFLYAALEADAQDGIAG